MDEVVRAQLEVLLQKEYREVSEFAVHFIATNACIKENVDPSVAITGMYTKLKGFGIGDKKIAAQTELLGMSPETVQSNFDFLRDTVGLTNGRIATLVHLLGMNPETLRSNYNFLHDVIGLTKEKIASQAELLGRDKETIQDNYNFLHDVICLTKEKIASRPDLLGRNPETIQSDFDFLHDKIGLTKEKIASQAHLLGRGSKTIQKNYANHVGLLRSDYKDRSSGRSALQQQAQLLGVPRETVASNVQYLTTFFRIDPKENPMLLGTTVSNKRQKFALLLREVFDYRDARTDQEKRNKVERAKAFVNSDPRLLVYSLARLDKEKDRLRMKAAA
jgi:hypothetical protein